MSAPAHETTGASRIRRVIFGVACVVAILSVALYVGLAPAPSTRSSAGTGPPIHTEPIARVPDGGLILFGHGAPGALFGRVAVATLPLAGDRRLIAPLSCERVHYAAGAGVCMRTDERRLPPRYVADTFDSSFHPAATIPLTGPPIRARVAPNGKRAALTVFETGHSYADATFSTRTLIVDMPGGERIADLEDFAVQKDGAPFKAVDFNFWGVTFARDGDEFYATLKTGAERYLVKGSIDARAASVVRAGVECPSLSPDGRRIVFKKALAREVGWRLHVLDLASGMERPLNQVGRSVDDQVDWFDADHVVYHESAPEGTGIWLLSADGVSPPRLLIAGAYSPAVQR